MKSPFRAYYSGSRGNLYTCGSLLLEAGVPIAAIKKALDHDISWVSGCLITHAHKDHSFAGGNVMAAGIDVYCSEPTARLMGWSGHRLHIIEPGVPFQVGEWSIMPFEVEHDCEGTLGFVLNDGEDKVLYLTDAFYTQHRFRGLTIIAIECNWSPETLHPEIHPALARRIARSHMSLQTCREFLQAQDLSHVREIHLIHISEDNGDADRFVRAVQRDTGLPTYIPAGRHNGPVHGDQSATELPGAGDPVPEMGGGNPE